MNTTSVEGRLRNLYRRTFDVDPAEILTLKADGSNRQIYRLIGPDGERVIGVHGPDSAENRAFLSFSRSLLRAGIPVPTIYGVDEENHVYLQEDLGDVTLFAHLSDRRVGRDISPETVDLYRQVVSILPEIQVRGGEAVDYSLCWPRSEFDRRSMLWDLHYFKYLFLKLTDIPFDEEALEDDFERLVDLLLESPIEHFLYRDFQSRNIMIRPDDQGRLTPWFIDYQGGRRGGLLYDIASLLYDAKADLPPALRQELLELYLDRLEELLPIDRTALLRLFRPFVLIRGLQALGAYGYRGLYEGKAHFIASIPFAINNISTLLADNFPVDLPELAETFEWLKRWSEEREGTKEKGRSESLEGSKQNFPPEKPEERETGCEEEEEEEEAGLQVVIRSFSYKKGSYPSDGTEHGGGFVFDCRAIHNPGRYEEYRELTGRDREVASFLEGRDDVEAFWENIRDLAARSVERYLERNFTYLSLNFGCTGGQHRSVYFAERLAFYLRERFPSVSVELIHREHPASERFQR